MKAKTRWEWLMIALQLRGSVVPAILPRTLLCGVFAVAITLLHILKFPVQLPGLVAFVPNLVLSLLLVFRTNTAYERFWEGRRVWGGLTNDLRNLSRQIWVAVQEETPQDKADKILVLRLLVAFAMATKQHLRQEPLNQDLLRLMPSQYFAKLQQITTPPLEIALWIGDYLQMQYQRGCLHIYQLNGMQMLLDDMVNVLGASERILKTPIPLAYAIHLKQLLLLYCLSLPFQMVDGLGWLTGPVVTLLSFTLFGIEEIGVEIENPFGRDPNDLPLDAICEGMLRNVEDLIALSPRIGAASPKP